MTVLIIKGGESVEHEVSLSSAENIKAALEALGHEVKEIFISKSGLFLYNGEPVSIDIERGFVAKGRAISFDVVFPIAHGHGGEDGKLQGLLELMHIPYASEDSLTSQIGMHKHDQMILFSNAGIPTIPSITVNSSGSEKSILERLGSSLVVKPESGGSSVGVTILASATEENLEKAIESTLALDENVIVQRYIQPLRELDVGAIYSMRNERLLLLGPIEIRTEKVFLDYQAKYHDVKTVLDSNPDISRDIRERMLSLAEKAFLAVHGSMYMRLDFFLSGDSVILNEINTIPGMTPQSHFPVLSREMGGMEKVLPILLDNAILRERKRRGIRHSI